MFTFAVRGITVSPNQHNSEPKPAVKISFQRSKRGIQRRTHGRAASPARTPAMGSADDKMTKHRRKGLQKGAVPLLVVLGLALVTLLAWRAQPSRSSGSSRPLLLGLGCAEGQAVGKAAALAAAAATAPQCTSNTTYHSSELELLWLQHAREWQVDEATFCKAVESPEQVAAVSVWLDAVHKLQNATRNPADMDAKVFSRFETTFSCVDGTTQSQTTWIEPLSHSLRHPYVHCGANKVDVLDMSYLVLANAHDVDAGRALGKATCSGRACQSIYIDLGATLFVDWNGPGQGWFHRSYDKRGLSFDRYLVWEAAPQTPTAIFKELPKQLMDKYQYFNIPASTVTTDPSHPVQILKRIAQPGDFVVFKLDVDNGPVEMAILKALMDDAAAFALVDEFFFEFHVGFMPMQRYWGGTADMSKNLADGFEVFLGLRQRGWRAHSWV